MYPRVRSSCRRAVTIRIRPTASALRTLCLALAVSFLPAVRAQAEIIDASFNPNANGTVLALAVQPDGKLLVGGAFTRIGSTTRNNIARLNVDGSLDAFNPGIAGPVLAIALQPDGKILVGGSFRSVTGSAAASFVRLHANGAVDTGFNANVVSSAVRAILVQPDGKLLIGGSLTSVGGSPRSGLARLNADGSLDAGFTADASGTFGTASPGVFALARQADGSILLGGQFTTVAGVTRYGLARTRSDGTLDPGFNPLSAFSSIVSITIQRDGKILLGGGGFVMESLTRRYIARFNANGTLDAAFEPILNAPAQAVIQQADGKIVIGGLFTFLNDSPRSLLARLNANGSRDTGFGVEAAGTVSGAQPAVNRLVATAEGRIYIGGSFSAVAGQSRGAIARLVPPAPQIMVHPRNSTVPVGGSVTFTATVAGDQPTFQWRNNGIVIDGATNATFTILDVRTTDAGNYDLVATNRLGTAVSQPASLMINVPPVITGQPASLAVIAGQSAVLALTANGIPAPIYQWLKDGVPVPGATNTTHTIAAAQAGDAGNYTAVVSNSAGTVTSDPAALSVLPAIRLANVSVRTSLAGSQLLIVGFVVGAPGANILVRAAGPALADFGLASAMADPRLELYKDSTKLLENNDWPGVLATTMSALGAFPFPANSKDSAILQNSIGAHSAVAAGTGPGVVLVEIYDAGNPDAARLINVSARNHVGTDADRLIAGFNLSGHGTKRVLIRAVGPTIGGVPFNLPDTLADPILELYDAGGSKIMENDNWDPAMAAVFASVGAFALSPGSRDAALAITLNPGSYTAVVSGANNTTGVALVEVYELR